MIRVYLVDDEPLAVTRLRRLLEARPGVTVAGAQTDPAAAIGEIDALAPDALFLDIQMPEIGGFDLLARLAAQPLVVFTTAYDEYALRAFDVHSVDYLLKPVEEPALDRALVKLRRILGGGERRPDLESLVETLAKSIAGSYPERIASRLGDAIQFVDVQRVSHFFAEEKLTYAASGGKNYIVDFTLDELERKLDPRQFCRVHRATLVNLRSIHELHAWFGGKMKIRMRDGAELTAARERVRDLKDRLGLLR